MSNEAPATDQAERVYNLIKDLIQLKKNKKDTAAGFTAEIKRIEAEIKEVIEEESAE